MGKKIFGCLLCWNEMSILPFTFPFIEKHLDGFIVLDGGPQGTSTDGTWEWLKTNYGKNPKVHLITGRFGDHTPENNWNKVMRNKYLEILDSYKHPPEWVFVIDADETIDNNFIRVIRTEINACTNGKIMLRYPYYQFFKDPFHYYNGYENPNRFSHHLTRYLRGMRYHKKNSWLYDNQGTCFDQYAHDCVITRKDIHMYHYSHAESWEKMRYREWRYAMRGEFGEEARKKITKNLNEYQYIDRRIVNKNILKFKGIHPDHMQEWVKKRIA